MIITWIYLKDEPPPRHLTRSCSLVQRWRSNWRQVGRAEWSGSACDALTSLKEHAPLVTEHRQWRQAIMCPSGDLGCAGSGSGRVSRCGWCAGRTPCSLARPVRRGFPSRRGCRGPRRSGWCSSQMMCGLECWCRSRSWTTEKPKSRLALWSWKWFHAT